MRDGRFHRSIELVFPLYFCCIPFDEGDVFPSFVFCPSSGKRQHMFGVIESNNLSFWAYSRDDVVEIKPRAAGKV